MAIRKRGPKGRIVADPERIDAAAKPDGVNPDGSVTVEPVIPAVDPATVTGASEPIGDDHIGDDLGSGGNGPEQPARRGRGRPRGSGGGSKDKALPLNVVGLEKLLVGIHGGLAMLLSSPGFALNTDQKVFDGKTEAQFLSQSVADVARHYNPKIFDQKTMDWSNLIQCMALIYGPRVYNIRHDRAMAKARNVNPSPGRQAGPRPVDPQARADRAANNGETNRATPVPENVFRGQVAGIGEIDLPSDWLGKPN